VATGTPTKRPRAEETSYSTIPSRVPITSGVGHRRGVMAGARVGIMPEKKPRNIT